MTQGTGMRDTSPCVLIVDDDPEFRNSVGRLLRSVGLDTRQFSSVPDFFKTELPDRPICLVVDVRMPGRSGLELQRELLSANRQLPIIFITAHGDIPMTVRAMKAGAIEFLTKPFRDQDLLDAIEAGLARDRARRESEKALDELKTQFDQLADDARARDHDPGDGRPAQQANCLRYRHHQIDREGASRQSNAKNEGSFTFGARPNGGPAWAGAGKAAAFLTRLSA